MKKWLIILLVAVGIWYWTAQPAPIKNAGQTVNVIVAFGDSLTEGKGSGGKQYAYPAVLAELSGKTVLNMGLSGETAVHAPQRLPEVLAARPDMVLIEFGANDHMRSMSRENAVSAVAQLVDAVQAAGAIAVIVDTGGPGMGPYTDAYKKMAKKKQAVFVPGIVRGIFHKREYKSDMIHPNAAGYKIVAQKVYNAIKPYLK